MGKYRLITKTTERTYSVSFDSISEACEEFKSDVDTFWCDKGITEISLIRLSDNKLIQRIKIDYWEEE